MLALKIALISFIVHLMLGYVLTALGRQVSKGALFVAGALVGVLSLLVAFVSTIWAIVEL